MAPQYESVKVAKVMEQKWLNGLFCNAEMWSYLAAMHLISVGGWFTFCNYRPFLSPFSFPHPSLFAVESSRSLPEQCAAPPNADIRRTHIPTTRLPASGFAVVELGTTRYLLSPPQVGAS